MSRIFVAAAAILAGILPAIGNAASLYENVFIPQSDGWFSSIGGFDAQIADDFILSQPARIDHVEWAGSHLINQSASPFRIQFFADAGGEPAAAPFFDRTLGVVNGLDTGHVFSERIAFKYAIDMPPLDLPKNERFWVSIGVTTSDRLVNKWAWLPGTPGSADNATGHYRGSPSENWIRHSFQPASYRSNQAFLFGGVVVPEPRSLGLLAALFVGCAFNRLRMRG